MFALLCWLLNFFRGVGYAAIFAQRSLDDFPCVESFLGHLGLQSVRLDRSIRVHLVRLLFIDGLIEERLIENLSQMSLALYLMLVDAHWDDRIVLFDEF